MNTQDTLKFDGNLFYISFEASGVSHRASVFNLDVGVTFFVEGMTVKARAHGEQRGNLVVETFVVESQAWRALERIHEALRRRSVRNQAGSIGRAVGKYVALPLGMLLLVAGVSANFANRHESTQFGVAALPQPSGFGSSTVRTAPALNTEHPTPAPEKIAAALKQGVASGHYAVRIGDAKRGDPVYVFEDPQCSYCQAFAPELATLAKSRPVYVIPVSAIGGESSAQLDAQVLCAPNEKREAAWSAAMTGAMLFKGPSPQPNYTPDCQKAAEANDLIYQVIGLRATPSLFDSKGHKLPDSVEHSAAAVSQWLGSES